MRSDSLPVARFIKQILFIASLMFAGYTEMHAQLSPVWVQRYAGEGNNSDKYNALVKDNNGDFYLTGYTVRTGNQRDFLLVKTTGIGDTIWTRTFNGTNNGDDEGVAVALDAAGNIYATGYTEGDKSNFDFITFKYDPTGNQLWSADYNYEVAYKDDIAVGLAVDSAGNVYVTGTSDQSLTSSSNNDFATVKYDTNGNLIYVARKNGFGNGKDEAVAIAADNNGNCYVTGRSDSGNDDDYITIKYNPAGIAQWTKLYDGGNGDDRPAALVLTNSGNIVVTGRKDDGSTDDITTICYSNGGTQLWIKNYNGTGNGNDRPTAITTDLSGNIYITGESDSDPSFNTNYDFVTIKYSSSGGFLWAQLKAGAGGNNDKPQAIVTDSNGNVFVTGKTDTDPTALVNEDILTVMYDMNGAEQWSHAVGGSSNKEDQGYALAIDNAGNLVIAGKIDYTGTQQDAAFLIYDLQGNLLQTKLFNGAGDFSDNAFSVRTDLNGNVFVAGYTYLNGTNRDLLVRKYDSGGNILKTFLYNGTKNDEDEASDMILDASGNVYVTGFSKNSGSSSDFITIKFTNNLDTSWVRFYNYTANESDKAVSIALDNASNVYVTGYSDNNPSDTIDSFDFVTIKYNGNGASQWTNRYNAPANGDDKPVKVLVDQNGNTVVTGKSFNGSNDDMVTIQYNATGGLQWIANYNGNANGNDRPTAMVLDNSGNVYVTGSGFAGANFDDYVIVKYNQGGGQQWAQTYNGSGNDDDKPHAIALDLSGNILVTGQSDADTSTLVKNYNYVTVKYDNGGNFQWSASYDGSSGTDDIPAAMVVDSAGNIYVAGQSENGSALSPDKDYAVVKYNPGGAQQFYAIYNGPVDGTDGANAIALDGTSLYLTGHSQGGASQKDIATVKFDNITGIENHPGHEATGSIIYPNPVSDYATVMINENGLNPIHSYEIEVYNVLGRKMKYALYEEKNKLIIDVQKFSSGVYFYRIKNQNHSVASGKFIKQ